uniref:Uncharacterized protein n=1 Tax=Tanacetum cinerariifolium TaxID=118510 RepID=A0A699H1X6_TANCI|nr:hypothetical protein [Tanacetum cinerariifolium]
MSQDVLTIGSTMRIPLLYRASIAGTSSTEQPPLKDKSMWSDQEKKIQKIDCLARSLLIQDRKAVVLYKYETFKAIKGELLLDTYIRYLQVINDLKKCGYSKDNYELNFKFLNNLQPEWKQYATLMRQNKNLMDINIDALYNILKKNQRDITKVSKRKEKVVVSSDSKGSDDESKKINVLLAKAFNRKKFYFKPTNNNLRTSSASNSANKKQEYVKSNEKKEDKKTKMLLAKKDKDEEVLLAEDHAWMESSSNLDLEINLNMVFMAQIKKVLSDSEASSSSSDDKIVESLIKKIAKYHKRLEKANQQCNDFENQNKDLKDKYDVLKNQATTFEEKNNELNEKIKVLIEKNADLLAQTNVLQEQLKVKHVVIDTHAHRKQIDDQEILFDKMSYQLVEMNNDVLKLKDNLSEKETKIFELEECVRNNDLEIEKCLERLNDCENKLHKVGLTNQTIHMIMPSKDKLYNGRKGIGFENPSYFYKEKDLRPTLYDERVINLGAFDFNNARNVLCNARINDYVDVNDLFVFDDVSIRKSQVSKMIFRKKPSASLNVPSKSKLNKSLPRIMRKWLSKMKTTVRFGNKDFTVIVGYGDVVIRSMTIKRVYYVNGLVVVDDFSRYTWVFFLHSKDEASEVIISFIKKIQVNLQLQVQRVRTDNGMEFKNKTIAKKLKAKRDIGVFVGYAKDSVAFKVYNKRTHKIHESVNVNFDEISEMASKQFSLEPGLTNLNEKGKSLNPTVSQNNEGEVFHEVSELFQGESSSSSVNDDVQQSPEEVILPQTNIRSISNDMIPNVDEASSSHNVFNERLEDAYFDASRAFHGTSDVHTYYQPYPHETKWTKDHLLHKIIGDPKSSVCIRGQLVNSCLFACLLSSIDPANVAEALKDDDWVIAMQDKLDQFARLKVWRLVLKPKGKTVIKTKWIFKNKKDKSSLVIRNKARLVAVGYSQQEGTDYDEMFAPVA